MSALAHMSVSGVRVKPCKAELGVAGCTNAAKSHTRKKYPSLVIHLLLTNCNRIVWYLYDIVNLFHGDLSSPLPAHS